MTKKRLSPTLFLAISLGIFSATGMVGCSTHSAGGGDDESDVPPPDAGTDTVPQASADGAVPPPDGTAAAATNPDGTPVAAADAPPPPDGGVPPGGADAPPPAPDSATPPPVDMAASTPPPATPAAPAVAAAASATPPPMDTAPAPAPAMASAASADHGSGGMSDYTVREGDTLMKIAFETYGDLYKWKDIYQQNHDSIKNPNNVPPGTVLHIDKPSVPVAIERNGDQYMIKAGDTLGTISNDVYGTKSKWKKIWNNNKQLIKDPNKIYAGFYLFYTLTPSERKNLEERGGPGHAPAPLAENTQGDGNQEVADSATDNSQNVAAAQPQAQAPVAQAAPQQPMGQAVAQAKPVQMDNRAPASVVAKAAVAPGAASDDLNQVVQQVH